MTTCILCDILEGCVANLHARHHFAYGFMTAINLLQRQRSLGPLCDVCGEAMRVASEDIVDGENPVQIETHATGGERGQA